MTTISRDRSATKFPQPASYESSIKHHRALPHQGGEYLKQCVGSVLSQIYPDFELAVLDNRCQDGTTEWLASLGDSRVKLYTSSKPLTIEENWARAVEVPKDELVTFMGHDDLLDPNYLEIISNLIADYPQVGLYVGVTQLDFSLFWRQAGQCASVHV